MIDTISSAGSFAISSAGTLDSPLPAMPRMRSSGASSMRVCTVKLACSGSIRNGGSLATASRSGLMLMVSVRRGVFV
jgi:hypothetical protein